MNAFLSPKIHLVYLLFLKLLDKGIEPYPTQL